MSLVDVILIIYRFYKDEFCAFPIFLKASLKRHTQYFIKFAYEDLRTVDSDRAAGLYPFMVAPSGNTSDLSAVNCLLVRRDPSLAYEGERIVHNNTHKCKR